MGEELAIWDKVLNTAMSTPMIRVDRMAFLSKEFSKYGNTDQLRDKRPRELYNEQALEKAATGVINWQLTQVTVVSTFAGIPGGSAMFVTIPGDMLQFYGQVLKVAQKLAYIYGWPDLLDENGQITEGTRNVLTLFVGVMLGAELTNGIIKQISKNLAQQIAKRLPRQALMKTHYYPIVKEVSRWIGVRMTKEVFSKKVSKAIPYVAGIVSGSITYASFKPMAERLRKQLREDAPLLSSI